MIRQRGRASRDGVEGIAGDFKSGRERSMNFILSCKQITKLISESFVRRLSIMERLSLWIHTSLCKTCRSFRRFQMRLQHVISGTPEEERSDTDNQLSQTAKERIAALIESQIKKD
ncbi:MAG: hypothetical protein QM501_13720 [Gimesia sp.]